MALKDNLANLFSFSKQTTPTPTKVKVDGAVLSTEWRGKSTFSDLLSSDDLNLSTPYIDVRAGANYVPFGKDNLYPYKLLDMYNSSPFHGAIIEFKNNLLMKEPLVYKLEEDSLENRLQMEKLKIVFSDTFLRSFIDEILIHNRINLDVDKTGYKTTILPSEEVRYSADYERITVAEWNRRGKIEYKEPFVKGIGGVIIFQKMTKGVKHYAVPAYVKASNWIYLDGAMALFQKQNMDNSINPSAIITLFQTFEDEEKKKKFITGLTDAFASARNAGKVMVFTAESKETAPIIDIADANKLDEAFNDVQENIIKNISYNSLINPIIMGVATQGKLGATTEIEDAYKIFKNVSLVPLMREIEGYLNEYIKKATPFKGTVKFNRDISLLS